MVVSNEPGGGGAYNWASELTDKIRLFMAEFNALHYVFIIVSLNRNTQSYILY